MKEVTKADGLWATQWNSSESDLKTIISTERRALIQTIGGVFRDLRSGFDIKCVVDETADPETARIHKQLNVNRVKAEEILLGPMRQAYEAMEREFRRTRVNTN